MVESCDRVQWQQQCERWQRDDSWRIEVDWKKWTWWKWKTNWWPIEEPYKHAILFRLANQLKDVRNEDPLQVQYKYIWYEAIANEYTEDFIIDFGALTHLDLQTPWVRNARVKYKVLKNTTRYQWNGDGAQGLGHGAWAAGAMKCYETALPLYKIDWNHCKWSERDNNSCSVACVHMRASRGSYVSKPNRVAHDLVVEFRWSWITMSHVWGGLHHSDR